MSAIIRRALPRISLDLPSDSEMISRLKAIAPNYLPELSDLNDASVFIRLGELFAVFFSRYAEQLITDIVNESFIATATQRGSLSVRAIELGYVPVPGAESVALVTMTNSSLSDIIVRRSDYKYRTARSGDNEPIEFEMSPASVLVPANSSVSFYVVQGQTVWNELLGSGDGTSFQVFSTRQGIAVPGSERVYVAGVLCEFAPSNNLLFAGADDCMYERWYDDDGALHIRFGDGVNGKRPVDGEDVICSYRVIIEGQDGNVPAGSITELSPASNILSITNNAPASGWRAADSIDDIRFHGWRSARMTSDYCIGAEDTEENIERYFDVLRCYVIAGERGENTRGVHLLGNGGLPVSASIKRSVKSFIDEHKPATERIFIFDGEYTDISVDITVYHDSSYIAGAVKTAIESAFDPLGYDTDGNRLVSPGEIITVSRLLSIAIGVAGINDVKVNSPTSTVSSASNALPRVTALVTEMN